MTDRLDFTVRFHSPFRVATGSAGEGYDAVVDLRDPLPASSLKGLMAAAARHDLELADDLVDEVFGSPRLASAWHWTPARFADARGGLRERHRVAINPRTHAAVPDQLLRSQVLDVATATFSVNRAAQVETRRLRQHRLVLTASARAVHALGAQRRRGLGWVGIDGGDPLNPPAVAELLALRRPA